jgi:putative two-component system response regulator
MNSEKRRILIVDDEPNNLQLMKQVLQSQYELAFSNSGINALDAVKKTRPDLILLDIMMPGIDGYETCRRLKSDPVTAKIPVIFVSAMSEVESERHGFEVGGVDYIAKPISAPIVQARAATHLALYDQQRTCEELIIQRTAELEASQRSAIFMLAEAGDYNDTDTGVHIWRMAEYAAAMASALNWKAQDSEMLKLAAPMHDTGKIGIPDNVLKKPGKLDAQEWAIMKTHSEIGYKILSKSNTPIFQMASEVAFFHHEKWDGSGYPKGLSGPDIPESARIVAIADVFDALTMKRPYKEAWPVEKALEEIRNCAGTHFDPDLIEIFFSIETEIRKLKHVWDQREKEVLWET